MDGRGAETRHVQKTSLNVRGLTKVLTTAEQVTSVRHLPFHHIPSCRSSHGRKELHRLPIPSGLEAGVRLHKAVDDKGQNPNVMPTSGANEKPEVDARKGEICLEPHVSRQSRPSMRGHPINRGYHHRAGLRPSYYIMLVLIPLSLDPIQAPATDDVEHANAERSVERLLLEQKGGKV